MKDFPYGNLFGALHSFIYNFYKLHPVFLGMTSTGSSDQSVGTPPISTVALGWFLFCLLHLSN